MKLTVDDATTREFARRNNELVDKERRILANWQNPDLYALRKVNKEAAKLEQQAADYGVTIWCDTDRGYTADIRLKSDIPEGGWR